MKNFNISLVIALLFISNLAKCQDWFFLNTPSNIDWTNTVSFVNSNTGFFTAGFKIFKTTDSGNNWFLSANTTYQNFYTQFINENTGFTFGIYKIQKTTNCGYTWDVLTLDSAINSMYFIDLNNWYMFTANNSLKKTTDGGNSWQQLNAYLPSGYLYRTVYFINSQTGFIAGDNNAGVNALGLIRKSTDGGTSWISRASVNYTKPQSFTFLNSSTGFLTAQNKLYKTTDGGNNWQESSFGNSNEYYSKITFVNQNTGFSFGRINQTLTGLAAKTTNAGATWFQILNRTNMLFNDVCFTSDSIGYLAGTIPINTGCILKTTTGGLTFVGSNSSSVPDKFFLLQNYPNPFNPVTVISYQLPVVSAVSLKVYDAVGNEVQMLVNEKQNAGSYSVDFNAASLPSGIYFYKLTTEKFTETKKMVLIK